MEELLSIFGLIVTVGGLYLLMRDEGDFYGHH